MLDEGFPTHIADAITDLQEAASTNLSEVLTMAEAARLLCVSNRTLERYVKEGAVPYTPLPQRGGRVQVRFLRSQLIRWLQNRTVRPSQFRRSRGNL
jgi:excisionase family DNA binding protein